jgi:hypothetical protein
MTNIGIKSQQLSNIRAALLETAKIIQLNQNRMKILEIKLKMLLIALQMLKKHQRRFHKIMNWVKSMI